ncbi:MAG: YfhO family protein [Balneola sp.]|nr:YfhO family protein [Balneola sp.]MBO6651092.1 YfhO family protein [Balneola sp.]MBO6712782.1 YfhO family protein [Balneola sp.]MBO6801081.1 YfhO family protein [Balneola sp.]MBO6871273.1 YfhO family protein [Balneola sp.]
MTEQNKNTSQDGFFYNLSEVKQHLIALAVLFLVPFILFTATTIGGKEFQRHDITQWRAGAESIIEYREQYGKEPLWAENMYMGMPAYVVSVKNEIPNIDRLSGFFKSIYPAFPYWVMLSGMYFLLILMGFKPLTAVFGSLLYSLTTYFPIIIGAGHTSKFVALAYAPWVLAGYWKLTHSKNRLAGLLLFSVAMALEVRAGHPQITYYFMYLLGFLWIANSWKLIQEKNLKQFGIVTGLLVLGGVIGILGHAQNFLTLQEYSQYSIRGGSALDGTTGLSTGYAFAWSQGIKESLTLLVPEIFGGASPTYFGPKSVTSGPHYLGALCLPFLLIALFRQRSRTMFVFFGTGTLALLFAWGENFAFFNELAFDYIPFFNKFRAPETWLVLTSFCYTVVAVYGLDWFFDFVKQKTPQLKELYAPLGTAVLIFVFVFVQVKTMDYTKPGEVANIANQIAQQSNVSPDNPQVQQRANTYVQQNFVSDRQESANKDVFRFGLFLIFAGALIWFALKQKLSVTLASLGLIVITGFDMISVGKRYVPERVVVNANVNPGKYLESQKRDIDQFIVDNIYSENGEYRYRVFPLLVSPFQEATPSYFYPTVGGYTGAKLSIVSDITSPGGPLYTQSGGLNLNLLGALNVKYVNFRPGLPFQGLTPVFNGNSGTVYENQKIQPKAFFVDSLVYAETPNEAFDFISNPEIDYSKVAVIENSDQIQVAADSTSEVTITNYTGSEIALNISRSTPGFLVLSEIYYPAGWVATLNGEEIEILKTNYVLRGMKIPAGDHELVMEFKPSSYSLGVTLGWISLVAQILIALAFGVTYFRNNTSNSE